MSESSTKTIHLMIIDDHAMFREGLTRMLERESDLTIVGQYASAADALSALGEGDADVVLLDVDLASERAMDFVASAKREGFEGKILIVTAGVGDQEAVQLVQAGVAGILHKQNPTEVLCNAIRQVASGEVCLEKQYLGPLFRSAARSQGGRPAKLTERDKSVLRFTLQGLTNKEIADRMDLSEAAVKASLRTVFNKLNVRTRAQAVKVVLEQYRDQL